MNSQETISDKPYSPIAIYHAFDTSLDKLTPSVLSKIKKLGFSHVQISPIQECCDYGEWHAKYQPTGYNIGNSYGTKTQLINLIERAHSLGLKIIVDVVFNHLASLKIKNKVVSKQEWALAAQSPSVLFTYRQNLFNQYKDLFRGANHQELNLIFTEWSQSGWIGGALPQINPQHPLVSSLQTRYLKELVKLGVNGFRFDGIEHLGLGNMNGYLKFSKQASDDLWNYGEIVTTDSLKVSTFSNHLPITDYLLLENLIRSFSYHGSLGDLADLFTKLPINSIRFSRSHDTHAAAISNGEHGVNMQFSSEEDCELAAALILAHPQGVPLILATDVEKPLLQLGMQFRSIMQKNHANMYCIASSEKIFPNSSRQTFLLMSLGREGLFLLNKSNEDIVTEHLDISFLSELSNSYVDLKSNTIYQITNQVGKKLISPPGKVIIPRRSCLYLVRESSLQNWT